MFAIPAALLDTFQPEAILTPLQNECYKSRAQALRKRFPWSEDLIPVWNATLVHLSANVPGKIAYYSSVENMVNNRLTRTSPEMFLARALIQAPENIRMAWSVEVLGQTLPEVSFAENTESDLWYDIYDDGPHSCMAGYSEVRQYAHPENNLALAYHQTESGKITQRTIVNKLRKTYLRIYGKENAAFAAALKKLGYSHSHDTLWNEKVHLAWCECKICDTMVLVGPYLDGAYNRIEVDPNNNDVGFITNIGLDFDSAEEAVCDDCRCSDD
jgi:hypothetical protein